MASRRLNSAGSAEQRLGQLLAVDLAVGRGAGKRGLDRGDGGALVKLVHLGVGVAYGNAERPQARRHGGLAHADGAGEADDAASAALDVGDEPARAARR